MKFGYYCGYETFSEKKSIRIFFLILKSVTIFFFFSIPIKEKKQKLNLKYLTKYSKRNKEIKMYISLQSIVNKISCMKVFLFE